MTDDTHDTDDATDRARTPDASEGHLATPSRRTVLSGIATAGVLGAGAGLGTGRRSPTVERCEAWDEIDVADGRFLLLNNQWSDTGADSCVFRSDDGRYGWQWSHDAGAGPNYPEVLLGTKPWGTATETSLFPVQLGDVEELDVALDVDVDVTTGQNWNLALEWWLLDERPAADVDRGDAITHEIMTVLDRGPAHGHGGVVEERAFTDAYGTAFDYWTNYDWDWNYHVFKTSDDAVPERIDFTAHLSYLREAVDDDVGFGDDLWTSGLELGSEYWADTAGEVTITAYDATLNGTTASSGPGDGGDGEAPDDGDDPGGAATLLVDDFADWPAENALGRWTGAGAFERAAVVDGALRLAYDDAGWFASNVRRSVAAFDRLELDVRGDDGGEETEIQLEVGGVEGRLADLTDDVVTTRTTTLTVDLEAVGVDRSTVDDVRLNCFGAGTGAIEVRAIRFAADAAGDATAPGAPAPVSVTGATSETVSLSWSAVADEGGSGLARYRVAVDGQRATTVPAGTTETTLTGLDPDTTYEVAVVAADGAGNVSDPATVTATTTPEAPPEDGDGDALVVNDYDGDPAWPTGNDLGNWNGAGGFENGGGDGEVVDGALVLEYDAAGWLVEQVLRDVSDYDRLVLRASGDDVDGSDVRLELGGAGGLLADLTDDRIGTDDAAVAVDLADAGIDASAPGELRLNFWQGGAGTLRIDEIRFE